MQKKLNVSGMMCQGCENRVINALSSVDAIDDVKASSEKGIVEFTYTSEEDIKKAIELIENLGFKVNE